MGDTQFSDWAILELMGHRRLAGFVTETVIGGGAFLRIDIPGKDDKQTSQFYTPQAVYCITPTTEEIARAVALQSEPAPVYRWELSEITKTAQQASEDGLYCHQCGSRNLTHESDAEGYTCNDCGASDMDE